MSDNDELDDEIIQEFLIESHENLDQLDRDLVALEQDPAARDLLASIFRTIHTIKGTSGFLAFHKLEAITHVGESLLAKLRDGVFTMTPEITGSLLQMVDMVRALLTDIEQHKVEGDTDVTGLAAELQALIERENRRLEGLAAAEAEAEGEAEAEAEGEPAEADASMTAGPAKAPAKPRTRRPRAPQAANEAKPANPANPANQAKQVKQVKQAPVETVDVTEASDARPSIGDSTIRVDVSLLEQLVRLTGELVLARNQIIQRAGIVGDEELARSCHRLNQVTGELQEGVMRTRMQPIDHVWSKLPRVVRDLSAQLGRKVRLEMEGGDTELDRTLLEAVKDPLTHLVRNAIDHGIEPPDVRSAAGKPDTGVLRLRAAHEGGQVLLEVIDDGKGLDPAFLGAKAVEKGLVSAAKVETMSQQELLDLVFVAGFSTASQVTNVSGRGVGMDVVRTNIERIGGSIDVDSTVGRGACWRLRIPLTLAIVPALTIECCRQRFALPQINLLELVSLDNERAAAGVESVGGAKVYRLRGSLLPLVYLGEVLGLQSEDRDTADLVVAVVEADGRRFGLVVDRVLDTEEIVVKPLSSALKEIGLYAGATILGDGAVSLILDVQSLGRRHLHATDIHEDDRAMTQAAEAAGGDERQLLVVGLGGERRVAVPLEVVTRLEQFPVEDIQRVGRRDVVRYRGEILPVVRLGDYLGSGSGEEGETIPGVVYSSRGRSVALIVNDIVDIVSEGSVVHSDVEDDGLVGSALIRDRVTELLDVRAAILAADPMYFDDELSFGEQAESVGAGERIGVQ